MIKRPGSPFYYACYTSRDGNQLKKSTKTSDRRQALGIAVELERVEMQSRQGVLTTNQLRKILNDVSEKITGDAISVVTVEVYLGDWLKAVAARIEPLTLVRYQGRSPSFCSSLAPKLSSPSRRSRHTTSSGL